MDFERLQSLWCYCSFFSLLAVCGGQCPSVGIRVASFRTFALAKSCHSLGCALLHRRLSGMAAAAELSREELTQDGWRRHQPASAETSGQVFLVA